MTTLPYPLLDIELSINTKPPTLNFVFPNLGLLAGTVGTINAPGASGKSWLALQLATYLTCNFDTIGLGNNNGNKKVLILAGEDPAEILSRRLHVLAEKMTNNQKSLFTVNLTVACCLGKTGDFNDGGKTANEISAIASDYSLVIVDTLSRWHSGEENDRKDAANVMRQLEMIASTGPAVIFLHHIGKATNSSSQHAGRGSSVWADESRWVGYLENVTIEDAKKFGVKNAELKKLVRFGVSKVKYSAIPAPILLERGQFGELINFVSHEIEDLKLKPITSDVNSGVSDGDF
jgi:RecA-family ATPase